MCFSKLLIWNNFRSVEELQRQCRVPVWSSFNFLNVNILLWDDIIVKIKKLTLVKH